MYQVSTSSYSELLRRCWDKKAPLYVYGGPGIGKSEIPRQVFSDIAKKSKKEFVEWSDLSIEQKKNLIANPDNYFVFCDQRISQMDSTDLRGIPNMVNTEMLETIPMSWVIYFTQEKAHGVIFFDEMNLAAPVVAGQAYQIINDRAIADRRLGKDVFVFGAGNRATDQAHVFEMPLPLRDRFCELEITPEVKPWTEWAAGKINPHLVAFVNWKNSYLYKVDQNAANKSSTPRGIVRASKLIEDEKIESDLVHSLISISVGDAFATEFQAYVKHYKALNWNTIYSKPETVENFEIDKVWAIVGGMSEQFQKGVEQERFNEMMSVVTYLKEDFAIVCLRMLKDSDLKKFGKQIKNCKDFKTLVTKYSKFIVD